MNEQLRLYNALCLAVWSLGIQIFMERLTGASSPMMAVDARESLVPFLAQPEATEQPTIH